MSDPRQRFTGRVEDYARYRQRYPAEQVISIFGSCAASNPHGRFMDIGAGTGMLSQVFLGGGDHVLAVAPNAEMLVACERLREGWPGFKVVRVSAEDTMLADASIE